ncbi:MAG TPA: OmpA family protein [Flavipsychrobacter sp.]|nr:OmpA family protein [Flavipsychrobacter sp.]
MSRFFKISFIILFIALYSPVLAQSSNDSIKLYFDLNVRTLSKQAQAKIDSEIYYNRIIPGKNLFIVGYADYLGSERYNNGLSEARAKNVADYLENYGISQENIKVCIGKGEVKRNVPHDPSGFPLDRRVDIVIQKAHDIPASAIKKTQPSSIPVKHDTVATMEKKPVRSNDITDIKDYKPGDVFIMKNIYFLPQRHTIRPESLPELEKLYKVLEQNENLKVKIEGHVCCIFNFPDAYDMDNGDSNLSVNRAKFIYDYLVKKGIDPDRLKYAGYGHSRPIVPVEKTEEDANKNRRVEIRVLEN